MSFDPLKLSPEVNPYLLRGPDQQPLRYASLDVAMEAASKLDGEQAVLVGKDGSYHLANRDSLHLAPEKTRKADFSPAIVAFEHKGQQVLRAGANDLLKKTSLELFLKGDGRIDQQEMALLVRQMTDAQGRLKPGGEYAQARERLVDLLSDRAPSSFDALIERVVRQGPNQPDTPDMVMLNLLASSREGAALIGRKIQDLYSDSGLLSLEGRAVVERLLATGSGRELIDNLVQQSMDRDPAQAQELLRALASSTTARRHFYDQMAHPQQPHNPFAGDGHLRQEVRQFLETLQQMSAADANGQRLFDLEEELLHPNSGFTTPGYSLTDSGRQVADWLPRDTRPQRMFQVVGLNNRADNLSDDDRQVVRHLATSEDGREALRSTERYLQPKVFNMVQGEMDAFIRHELVDRVYEDLQDNRYGSSLGKVQGQLNRGGSKTDCYDACWDIVSSLKGIKDAQPLGQQNRVSGLSLQSRNPTTRDAFVNQLHPGDVLHLGPPHTHWVVYMGRDEAGTPQIMHGNWKSEEYVPATAGETREAKAPETANTDRSVVITSLDSVLDLPRYGGKVGAVYRPAYRAPEGLPPTEQAVAVTPAATSGSEPEPAPAREPAPR